MGPPPLSAVLRLIVVVYSLLSVSYGAGQSRGSNGGNQQQQTPVDFDCPEEFGYYAHPTDCTLYYVCVFGGALLESCTGGLMYSHELQTCDWPRNVGCAPGQQQISSQPQQQHLTQKISQQPVSQQVDTGSSRGRQRQQQIQIPKADLYTEEEELGPAEELESDRQQRVYRGQPSTLGQVASDRDGLTHSNAIPVASTGGRDKLSVVSYGPQQQYNSKNERGQTDGVYNSDHNFLTNISRVRKKRDNTNSNRRSNVLLARRRKRGHHQNKHGGRRTTGNTKIDVSTKNSTSPSNPMNATERSLKVGRSDDYDSEDGGLGAEKEEPIDDQGNDDDDYDEKDDSEEEEDDEDEEEQGEEEMEEDETDKDKDNNNSTSDENNSDFNFERYSNEKNSSSEDFMMDFPDPPPGWDSFEDAKFPFDDMDFDLDKFLADLKNEKFDDFVMNGKEGKGPSTTVYPTSIFNFGSSHFPSTLDVKATNPSTTLDFYFPNFSKRKGTEVRSSNTNNSFSESDTSSGDNKSSTETKASPSFSEGFQIRSTSLPASTLESPLQKITVGNQPLPIGKNDILRRVYFPQPVKEAQDRSGHVDGDPRINHYYIQGKGAKFSRPQNTFRANNTTHGQFNPENIHKWANFKEDIRPTQKVKNPYNRGTAKFTVNTTPVSAPSTTPKYKSNDSQQPRATNSPLSAIGAKTTEHSSVIQMTPRYSVQITEPTQITDNQQYRNAYSTHHDSTLENPRKPHGDNKAFTTPKPNTESGTGRNTFARKSTESLPENNDALPTNDPASGQKEQQRVISYSYPSASFHESRGPGSADNFKLINGQFEGLQQTFNHQFLQKNGRQNTNGHPGGHQRKTIPPNYGHVRHPAPHHNSRPVNSGGYRNQLLHPNRQRTQPFNNRHLKQRSHHQNIIPGGRTAVNNNYPNHNQYTRGKNLQHTRDFVPVQQVQHLLGQSENYHDDSRSVAKGAALSGGSRESPNYNIENNYEKQKQGPQNHEHINENYSARNHFTPINNIIPNATTVPPNNKKLSFSYVNFHDDEKSSTKASSPTDIKSNSSYPNNHRQVSSKPFRPSKLINTYYEETTPKYQTESKEDINNVMNSSSPETFSNKANSNPPAGSYVYFTSNVGPTVAVPVHKNNLYENHKDEKDESYNDYYNDYDEGDYEDEGNKTVSSPKPPQVPKTLQHIDYKEYDDSEYDDYSDDDKEYDEGSDEDDTKGKEGDEEYYDDEEESDGNEDEPSVEHSMARPLAAGSTTTSVGCIPANNTTPSTGEGSALCPSIKPTDKPTTTADEQKNSEQTIRTITLLRASVQPVQQQVYDTRGYNTTRYIQQQQYDPNYYTVYDEEAEQYKDIADYAQYVQQNNKDVYTRKKPSVEIVQQEPVQRGYSKSKYSNQPENIYQSVTPQEYDSYSIQTNDDIPYRQVQTKSNNRFPDVKESGPTQGERRLITLSAKYSHEGTVQTDSQTNTDRDNGSQGSDAVTEASVVNITPRKSDWTSASSEATSPNRSSFAQQINALAQKDSTEDPVAKVLEALTKSEEYLSDEASIERSTEGKSSEQIGESGKASLTVEELDIDFLKKLKSQSEESLNRFRFSPRSQEKPSTQPIVDLSHYRLVQTTPTPIQSFSPAQGNRQPKVVQGEVTTPKPLILRLSDNFNSETASYERTQSVRFRTRPDSESREYERNYSGRQDVSQSRRGGSRHHNHEESAENPNMRRPEQYIPGNQPRFTDHQQNPGINNAYNVDSRGRGHVRNDVAHENRQQSSTNRESPRNYDPATPKTIFTSTPVPLRISVAPIQVSNNENLREQIVEQYNYRVEENRKQSIENGAPARDVPISNTESPSARPNAVRNFVTPRPDEQANRDKNVLIRFPENSPNTNVNQRPRLMPLSDYVNSNVKTMIDDSNRGRNPSYIEEPKSIEEPRSIEEQTSEEARKPVAIRIPESVPRRNSEERPQHIPKYDKSEGYSRKPTRYMDSLEHRERNKDESLRGGSRYSTSPAEEYDNDELINITEEPRKPIAIRVPERVEQQLHRTRGHSNQREQYNTPEPPMRNAPIRVPELGDNAYQQEERRHIVIPPVQRTHEPTSTEHIEPEVIRSVAIKVPESINLNQYRGRDDNNAARIAESVAPSRTRSRNEEESRSLEDQRGRSRVVPPTSREEARSEEELRNRYEVATTLRPNRVLNVPTTSKPTRPPKKFRNGTLYSDLTLPIGTDLTDTDQPEPDTSIRARPMSNNVPTFPGLTRGSLRHRGSLTYTVSPNEAEPPSQPRGTPPPQRNRPTLKPSTTVVGKASEFVDIYRYPPRRPDNVYPTPQVDKTAAKCRKDVCLLPDCSCGGKDIPGELTPEQTPQIVLLTFDDSVNDLNKGLYSDLFEKGRVNPNGCPISATFYVSHEWTDYSQVQNLYATGHEIASHSVSHSFGEQFSQRKWTREIAGQREILAAYGGVKLEDIRGMRAPFLAVGGNKMFKMLYDSNFTYDSSMPVYENRPPSWPYTLDYKVFHDCMIPPCPTKSYPGVWEVPMVMWQDLNGGRCSMGDACSNPPEAEGVYKMLLKNFERHFTTNRAPFGLFYHAAWFTQPHHKEGFIAFLDTINKMPEVWIITNWQAIQWVRDPTPLSRLGNFAPFQCNYPDRPKKCNNPKVCNLWHKSGVRYMRTCQACPEIYPWTGKSGVRNSRIDNDLE